MLVESKLFRPKVVVKVPIGHGFVAAPCEVSSSFSPRPLNSQLLSTNVAPSGPELLSL